MEFREDLLFRDFFRELSEKDCREKDDPVFEIEYLVEIVLLHVYRMLRTRLEAFAAVDASILFIVAKPPLMRMACVGQRLMQCVHPMQAVLATFKAW